MRFVVKRVAFYFLHLLIQALVHTKNIFNPDSMIDTIPSGSNIKKKIEYFLCRKKIVNSPYNLSCIES